MHHMPVVVIHHEFIARHYVADNNGLNAAYPFPCMIRWIKHVSRSHQPILNNAIEYLNVKCSYYVQDLTLLLHDAAKGSILHTLEYQRHPVYSKEMEIRQRL